MLNSSRLTNWHQIFYFLINCKMHNLKRQTGGLHSIQSDLHREGGMTGMHAYQLGTSVPTQNFAENRGDLCHITAGSLHRNLSKLKITRDRSGEIVNGDNLN